MTASTTSTAPKPPNPSIHQQQPLVSSSQPSTAAAVAKVLFTPPLQVQVLAVLLVGALVAGTVTTMLAATVPASIGVADTFARAYGESLAATAKNDVSDYVSIVLKPYGAIYHAAATGLVPDFVVLNPNSASAVAAANATQRFEAMKAYRDVFRLAHYATSWALTDISAGFEDRTYINCVLWDRNIRRYRCWFTDYITNKTGWRVWRTDIIYSGTSVDVDQSRLVGQASENPTAEAWYRNAPRTITYEENAKDIDEQSGASSSGGSGGSALGKHIVGQFSDVYFHTSYLKAVVDLSMPLFDRQRRFIGVTSITLDAIQLSSILRALPRTDGSSVFAIGADGFMIGSSNNDDLWDSVNVTREYNTAANPDNVSTTFVWWKGYTFRRYTPADFPYSPALRHLATDHNDTLWRRIPFSNTSNASSAFVSSSAIAAAASVDEVGSDRWRQTWKPVKTLATRRLTLDGVPMYVTTGPMNVRRAKNLRLLLVSLVPEDDIVGDILRGYTAAVRAAAIVVLTTLVVITVAFVGLLWPLRTLRRWMENASSLRDADLPTHGPMSPFREVRAIQHTFYRLCTQLRRAKTYLPAATLALLTASETSGAALTDLSSHSHSKSHLDTSSVAAEEDDEFGSDDTEGALNLSYSAGAASDAVAVMSLSSHVFSASSSEAPAMADQPQEEGDAVAGPAKQPFDESIYGTAAMSVLRSTTPQHHEQRLHNQRSSGLKKMRTLPPFGKKKKTATFVDAASAGSAGAAGIGGVVASGGAAYRRGRVTVVACDVVDFHRTARDGLGLIRGSSGGRFAGPYGTLVECVGNAARLHRGALDALHGDHFTVSFNATRAITKEPHAVAACRAAVTIGAAIRDLRRWAGVTIGVGSGPAMIGEFGSSGQRRPMIVGAAVTRAHVLQLLCHVLLPHGDADSDGEKADDNDDSRASPLDTTHLPTEKHGTDRALVATRVLVDEVVATAAHDAIALCPLDMVLLPSDTRDEHATDGKHNPRRTRTTMNASASAGGSSPHSHSNRPLSFSATGGRSEDDEGQGPQGEGDDNNGSADVGAVVVGHFVSCLVAFAEGPCGTLLASDHSGGGGGAGAWDPPRWMRATPSAPRGSGSGHGAGSSTPRMGGSTAGRRVLTPTPPAAPNPAGLPLVPSPTALLHLHGVFAEAAAQQHRTLVAVEGSRNGDSDAATHVIHVSVPPAAASSQQGPSRAAHLADRTTDRATKSPRGAEANQQQQQQHHYAFLSPVLSAACGPPSLVPHPANSSTARRLSGSTYNPFASASGSPSASASATSPCARDRPDGQWPANTALFGPMPGCCSSEDDDCRPNDTTERKPPPPRRRMSVFDAARWTVSEPCLSPSRPASRRSSSAHSHSASGHHSTKDESTKGQDPNGCLSLSLSPTAPNVVEVPLNIPPHGSYCGTNPSAAISLSLPPPPMPPGAPYPANAFTTHGATSENLLQGAPCAFIITLVEKTVRRWREFEAAVSTPTEHAQNLQNNSSSSNNKTANVSGAPIHRTANRRQDNRPPLNDDNNAAVATHKTISIKNSNPSSSLTMNTNIGSSSNSSQQPQEQQRLWHKIARPMDDFYARIVKH